MFAGWGSWVARFRWSVLAVALVAVIGAGAWGLGVFGQLSEGGYNDPNSESTRAGEVVQEAFGARGGDLVAIYTPTAGKIDDAALGRRIRERLAALPESAVARSTSYWNQKSVEYAAEDKSSAIAVITLAGAGDDDKLDNFRDIEDRFSVDGASVRLSGAVVLADASSTRSTEDLAKAELISLPVTLVLLVLLFGSVVAASLPVLVGGAAVLGSLGILHAIASQQEVNSFAVNVASLLGLGMAIDYGLFMVGRFREELAEGREPAEAVRRTLATAGRTVAFSATLLMIALGGLLLFPQGFLNSLAYGGLAAVFLAALLSLTLLPALLAVLGRHVEKLPVRLPGRKGAAEGAGWRKLAGFVLRRPVVVVLPILAGLLLLAAPIRGVHFGESDERILPPGDPSRSAIEILQADYPQFSGDGVQIVLRGAGDPAAFAVAARQVPGVAELTPAEKSKGVTLFTATLRTTDPFSDEARDVVDALRSLPVPSGAELLVGGTTARNVDSLSATADRLPLMIGVLAGATLLLMFLAFGSVLLPIKAVAMSALSLSATFGTLVWIFQDGHGAGLLNVTPAPLEVGIVVLMAAVVFGLSTDYEVFLLSRMVEARTRGASTAEAVTTGLARTGRVISAAAVLLIVVTGAFALSSVATMRFVGVGMIIALLLDATVVRMLLAPAVLSLLGDAAWWAPGPLRRLQQRAGLAEYAGEEPEPATVRAGASDDTAVLTGVVGYGPAAARTRPASASASSTAATSAAVASAAATSAAAASTAAVSSLASSAGASAGGASSAGASSAGASAAGASAGGASFAGASAAGTSTAGRSASGASAAGASAADGSTAAVKPLPGEPSWIPATGELPALPAASSPLALPAGPADVTEILPKFDEVSAGNGSTTDVFGGRPAEPSFVASASSGGSHTDRSAPDEFFFGSSPGGYGLPVEPPAIEPPAPWRLPEITAGPTPTGAEPPSPGGDTEPDLDVTRSLDAPDLDATRTLIAPDLASTRQMPAPILRPTPSDDDADQPPAPKPAAGHIPTSVETSQRIFTRTESSIGRIPPIRDKDPDQSPPPHDPSTHRTPAGGRVPTLPPAAGGRVPAPPAVPPTPASAGGRVPADSDRIPTQRGQAAGRIPAPRDPEPDRIPAAARFTPEPEVVEEEPDLDVTRSLDAPDLDATRTLIAPDLASTRQMPAPILRPNTSDDKTADRPPAPQPAADDAPSSVETSQRIFTRTESTIGRIPPVRDADPGVPTRRDPAAARFMPEPEVVEEEPDLDVTRSLDAPDLDATRTLIAPDLASTRQMPAPLIPPSRPSKPATDDTAPTTSPATPQRAASGPMPVPRPAQTPDPRYVRDTPGPVPPTTRPDGIAAKATARPAEAPRRPQTTARPEIPDSARPASSAPYVEPRRPAAHGDLPTQHIPRPETIDPARPAPAGPYVEPRRPAAHADLPTQHIPRPETIDPARPAPAGPYAAHADLPTQRRRADLGNAFVTRRPTDRGEVPPTQRPADPGNAPAARRTEGLLPAQRRAEDFGGVPAARPGDLADIPARRQPDELGDPLPLRRPATLGDQPYSVHQQRSPQPAEPQQPWQPIQAWQPDETPPARHTQPDAHPPRGRADARPTRPANDARSQPAWQGDTQPIRQPTAQRAIADQPWRPAEATPARRPADLRDHLRESRPADLSQYSRRGQPARSQVPAPEASGERPRRPASLGDFPPARRPATLADHVRTRRSADEPGDTDA